MITTSRGSRPPAAWANLGRKAQPNSVPPAARSWRRDSEGASQQIKLIALPPLKLWRHQQQPQTLLTRRRTPNRLAGLGRSGLARNSVEQLRGIDEILNFAGDSGCHIEPKLHALGRRPRRHRIWPTVGPRRLP